MVDRTTTMGDKYGKKGLANQRVQPNSKYSHVGSTMTTGRTVATVATFSKSPCLPISLNLNQSSLT